MAREYSQRPSSLLRVSDEWAAYEVDLAAMVVGRWVEGELRKGRGIEEVLGKMGRHGDAETRGRGEQFRDARAMVTRKVAIGSSGVW
jgi:hypothetical protein